MFTFRNTSILSGIVALTISLLLMIAPQLILSLFGLVGNDPAYFLSRRAAMLFSGLGIVALLARDVAHSEARQAIVAGIGLSMGGLAVLGTAEWLRGYAGPGVFLAVGGELVLALSYLRVWRSNRE